MVSNAAARSRVRAIAVLIYAHICEIVCENGPNSVTKIWFTFLSLERHVYLFSYITRSLESNSRPHFGTEHVPIFQHSDAGIAALALVRL